MAGTATVVPVGTLIPTGKCFERIFASGSQGFFGTMVDSTTGKRYQIVQAVEIGTKGLRIDEANAKAKAKAAKTAKK